MSRTAGAGIQIWSSANTVIENCYFHSMYNGIVVAANEESLPPNPAPYTYTEQLHINRVLIDTPSSPNSIGIWINGNRATSDIIISNCIVNMQAGNGGAGLRITGTGGVWTVNCDFVGGQFPLLIDPGSNELQSPPFTSWCTWMGFVNSYFDSGSNAAVYLNAANTLNGTTGQIRGSSFSNCWASSTGGGFGHGFMIGGNIANQTQGIDIVGLRAFANVGNGIHLGIAAVDINIGHARCSGNGAYGINVGKPIANVSVVGCRVGASAGLGNNGAGGFNMVSGCTNFVIAGNNFLGNSGSNYTNASGTTAGVGLNLY